MIEALAVSPDRAAIERSGLGGRHGDRTRRRPLFAGSALALVFALPGVALAATVANPLCPDNTAAFNPDQGQDIVLPTGYSVSVFKSGLNFPTGIAFKGNSEHFEVYVLESGHGLPSRCNDQSAFGVGDFDPTNPITPDILVFGQDPTLLRTLAKPTSAGRLHPEGPAAPIPIPPAAPGC